MLALGVTVLQTELMVFVCRENYIFVNTEEEKFNGVNGKMEKDRSSLQPDKKEQTLSSHLRFKANLSLPCLVSSDRYNKISRTWIPS